MEPVSLLFLVQLVFDLLLLALVFMLYRRLGRLERSDPERISSALKEVERLTKKLEKNLAEKKVLLDRLQKLSGGTASTGFKEKVRDLYSRGKSPAEIANQLELTQGEVEIILSLIKGEKPAP
ncbi:hypothetical protein G4V39_10405 [Thermosulfuriphilus ammonigenes]|uniref:Uncharacterized protein n=1 Tax=Thermosulfuriphilus ammonigenes TaxID=1936021 RepID=A0A6G7PYR3_9BACT|nr:hypothetical protein [Thermosulfuriphilus ammonigenes]MBA2849791.1 DNA-binding NarL/FixJ family response regulator [Thermosulfuriphilus ammonigenes]QIJ72661.1 hypothetical protein G4V39_10405 [Thermosulfuriphilus ammonigenes]